MVMALANRLQKVASLLWMEKLVIVNDPALP